MLGRHDPIGFRRLPNGADAALRPFLREIVLAQGLFSAETTELLAAAAGSPPAATNQAIQRSPNTAENYRTRGTWYGLRGQWKAAAADYTQAMKLESDTLDAQNVAFLYLAVGDVDRYREHCQAILKRWASAEFSTIGRRLLKICLFSADAKVDPKSIARLVGIARFDEQTQRVIVSWSLFTKGLYEYRSGRYADALTACRESRQRLPKEDQPQHMLTALNLCVEAMALHRTGEASEAARTLAEARPLLDKHVPGVDLGPAAGWIDWLSAHILYREASALLATKADGPKE
ncbi:MAG TPA: tetratricopeptide repeat protein [Fimbriiglobus sp.]|nr:tetratricopeptide repeat protein [Fimbriiglobus sp.]